MKLLKHEFNRYHRSVQECIRQRKEWTTYYSIKLRWKKMRKEVDTFMVKDFWWFEVWFYMFVSYFKQYFMGWY